MVYLPTIIHVYLFTALFILYGALKSKSKSAYLSLIFFVLCTFLIFLPNALSIAVSSFGIKNFDTFLGLNINILKNLGFENLATIEGAYHSDMGIVVMRFIAFSYTYHYLNWFSKTSIIKWYDVSKQRLLLVICGWLIAISIYIYDYKIGFIVMYLLSFLHVLLEFPLNYKTIISIVQEIKN